MPVKLPPSEPLRASAAAKAELAPHGRLRAGIAVGPTRSPVWNDRDPDMGALRGVAVDLARAFAASLSLPLDLVEHHSSGAIIENAAADLWDVAFTPVDAERKRSVDFSTNYALGESTYLVRAGCPVTRLADADDPAVRIAGIEGTATLRAARAILRRNEAVGIGGLDEALRRFEAGDIDLLALGRDSILTLLPRFPGTRALAESLLATGTAVAIPKGRPLARDLATSFVERYKADGTLVRIFERNGFERGALAPPGSTS